MISNIGKYFVMLSVVFRRPKKRDIFKTRLFNELVIIGMNSLPIVMLMSAFMGGVIALQTASNITSPLLPAYTIGYITQSSTILEFSPTIISLILAGKVGSNIASEIGTMRVTDQIDALEILNSKSNVIENYCAILKSDWLAMKAEYVTLWKQGHSEPKLNNRDLQLYKGNNHSKSDEAYDIAKNYFGDKAIKKGN